MFIVNFEKLQCIPGKLEGSPSPDVDVLSKQTVKTEVELSTACLGMEGRPQHTTEPSAKAGSLSGRRHLRVFLANHQQTTKLTEQAKHKKEYRIYQRSSVTTKTATNR